MIYIGIMSTQQIYSVLIFDLYSCYMFRAYKAIIRQLYIGIRLVTDLPIRIHTSVTCRIVYQHKTLPQVGVTIKIEDTK
jgi:hypothetical protein